MRGVVAFVVFGLMAGSVLISPALAQFPPQPNPIKSIRIDLEKTQSEIDEVEQRTDDLEAGAQKTNKKIKRLDGEVEDLQDAAILHEMKVKSLNGTLVDLSDDVAGLDRENNMQWVAIGGLGAGQVIQGAKLAKQQGQIQEAAVTNALQDQAIADHEERLSENEALDQAQTAAIDEAAAAITQVAAASAAAVEQVKNDIVDIEKENDKQDKPIKVKEAVATNTGQIELVKAKNTEQDGQIADIREVNGEQNKRLNNHEGRLAVGEAEDTSQNLRIGGLRADVDQHTAQIGELEASDRDQWASINSHTALLSQHSAQIGDVRRGVATAMAMPNQYLGDLENFAVAGSLGYFDGETAIAIGAIGRLDRNWALNIAISADTGFRTMGGQVGVRRAW